MSDVPDRPQPGLAPRRQRWPSLTPPYAQAVLQHEVAQAWLAAAAFHRLDPVECAAAVPADAQDDELQQVDQLAAWLAAYRAALCWPDFIVVKPDD